LQPQLWPLSQAVRDQHRLVTITRWPDSRGRDDTNDTKSSTRDIPPIPMRFRLATVTGSAVSPINRRIQMRKISMFAAALVLIGIGVWAVATDQRVAASTPVGIDALQMMVNAKGLAATEYVDYTFVFN
jgi:hypothetical protein